VIATIVYIAIGLLIGWMANDSWKMARQEWRRHDWRV
jgi:hypothetical protein